jgi:hypothetical protein
LLFDKNQFWTPVITQTTALYKYIWYSNGTVILLDNVKGHDTYYDYTSNVNENGSYCRFTGEGTAYGMIEMNMSQQNNQYTMQTMQPTMQTMQPTMQTMQPTMQAIMLPNQVIRANVQSNMLPITTMATQQPRGAIERAFAASQEQIRKISQAVSQGFAASQTQASQAQTEQERIRNIFSQTAPEQREQERIRNIFSQAASQAQAASRV